MQRFLLIIILLFIVHISYAQEKKPVETYQVIDSLLSILKLNNLADSTQPTQADTTRIKILNSLSYQHIGIGDYDKAMQYATEAKKLAFQIKNQKGEATAYYNMGTTFRFTGVYDKAMHSFIQCLKTYEKLGDKKGIESAYSGIGFVYEKEGNFSQALDYQSRALQIAEEIKDKSGMARSYNGIATIYYYSGQKDKALMYFKKTLKISEELGNTRGLISSYNNIGLLYQEQKKYNEALENLLKALDLSTKANDKEIVATAKVNIGNLFMQQNKLEEAQKNFKEALFMFEEIKFMDGKKEVYFLLSELFNRKKDYKQALDYHKLYSQIKDTLLNEQSSKQITEMNAKYESEKKEKDIALLTKDQALQNAEIYRQKLIRNGFIVGLALVLILTFILLNRFKITSKQKTIIQSQNFQIVESINYSKKIQDSLLPSIKTMQASFAELFVFYDPKAIVSGDFYFFREFKGHMLIACVDCTGHGVPGGFMSTLGSLLLDKIANDEALTSAEILNKLSEEIIRVLQQQKGGEIQDGMDLSLCLVNRHENSLQFSGARNGLIVVSDNIAKRYKADILPVGGNYTKRGVPLKRDFKSEQIQLKPNDWVFMYTDGFMEQVGGEDTLPMNYSEFETHLIKATQQTGPEEKCELLRAELNKWCGKNKRDDDVLIIGFKKT